METKIWQPGTQLDNGDDDDDKFLSGNEETCPPPPGKRLAPVGANDEDEINMAKDSDKEYSVQSSPGFNTSGGCSRFWGRSGSMSGSENNAINKELEEKVKNLERDQEELNSSLMSMTSHFAKVQLRLQQVVSAPAEKKEALLMELQQFAFRGIPDISSPRPPLALDDKCFKYDRDDAEFNGYEATNNHSTTIEDSATGTIKFHIIE